MRIFLSRLVQDAGGQDLVEYVLLVALIGLAVAAAIPQAAQAIAGIFTETINCVQAGSCS